jgi:signal peptidase I
MADESKQRKTPFWLRILVGSRPKLTLVRLVFLAAFSFLLFRYALRPLMVDGVSMEPTVHDRTFRFANLLAYRFREPGRGDIVLIDKDGFNAMYMKRILGLPGELVEFRSGVFYVNGVAVAEEYLKGSGDWDMNPVLLGPGEYLVAGDNRSVPRRSHVMGVVRREAILGRLLGK